VKTFWFILANRYLVHYVTFTAQKSVFLPNLVDLVSEDIPTGTWSIIILTPSFCKIRYKDLNGSASLYPRTPVNYLHSE
jgi:hypothetical protein